MKKRFRALVCAIRRDHPWTCSTTILPQVDMQVHTHICTRCRKVVLERITAIEPVVAEIIRRFDPGLLPEDQAKYMN